MEEMLEQQNVDNVLSIVMELSSDTDIRAIILLWKHEEADDNMHGILYVQKLMQTLFI